MLLTNYSAWVSIKPLMKSIFGQDEKLLSQLSKWNDMMSIGREIEGPIPLKCWHSFFVKGEIGSLLLKIVGAPGFVEKSRQY